MTQFQIRPLQAEDLPGLRTVLQETSLFPTDMLDSLTAPILAADSEDLWLTGLSNGEPVGLCYAVPEPMADRVWNMRALGILPAHHRRGLGRRIVAHLERRLTDAGQRLLLVDTSGTPEFETARAFYRSSGYEAETRIRDYWAIGDDKITFRKILNKVTTQAGPGADT